jgi:hypothetical protein
MVGRGVLAACLEDPRVERVVSVGRSPLPLTHTKLRDVRTENVSDLADLTQELASSDACFFSLGVSSAGMDEGTYSRLTYDLTVRVAEAYERARPGGTFCYVSGQGTDSSEKGRTMWARVKGKTENRLLRMRLNAFMLRPGYIQPMRGVRSKTALYRLFYGLMGPLFPLLRRLAPRSVTTSETLGKAMIELAVRGSESRILGTPEINALAGDA